jgi:hypothetical protein
MSAATLARTPPPPYYAVIFSWKANVEHLLAQQRAMRHWYQHCEVRIARVERAYGKPPDR